MKEDTAVQFNRIVFRSDTRHPITVRKAVENILTHAKGRVSFDDAFFALAVTGVVEPGMEAGQTVRMVMNDFGYQTQDEDCEHRQRRPANVEAVCTL